MIYYEFRKLVKKTSTKVMLAILTLVVSAFCLYNVFSASYILENGQDYLTGISAIHRIKEEKSQWNGVLDEKKIQEAITFINAVNQEHDFNSKDIIEIQMNYARKQGVMDIYNLLNNSFCSFRKYDYYQANNLYVENAQYFYSNRLNNLIEWSKSGENWMFTDVEWNYFIDQYKEMPEPLNYSYQDGWNKLFGTSTQLLLIAMVIISLIVSSIFSSEFSYKAESILLSTKYGRTKAMRTKVVTGILAATGLYIITILTYSLVILGVYGFDGADCLIQSNATLGWNGWKSLFYITNLETFGFIFLTGLIGTLFVAILSMFVSYKTRSTVMASIIAFLILIVPGWLKGIIQVSGIEKVLSLFCDQLFYTNINLISFERFEISGMFISPIWINSILYTCLSVILILWVIRSSKKLYLK